MSKSIFNYKESTLRISDIIIPEPGPISTIFIDPKD